MSGSSSSGRSYTGSGGNIFTSGGSGNTGGKTKNCSTLKGKTIIMSPNMTYFMSAFVGSQLEVIIVNETVALVNKLGDEVGSINPSWIVDLIECLKKRNKYLATIVTINGAAIEVFIESV
ncbi:hypothetical protein KKG81_01125 [bacterium]|jgi:hypothetical protein|nr:hypothetical protein [bacterium]